MDIVLDGIEVRVLGCLIEKEMATPEYYPLSLNALTNACNQKSNRNPVLVMGEQSVLKGLEGLRQKGLATGITPPGERVTKYMHEMLSKFELSKQETALICELMLRGPQTQGELRSNAARLAPFGSLNEVEEMLRSLIEYGPPLVMKLPREAGKKESRYMHLFAGADAIPETAPETAELPDMASGEKAGASAAITELKDEVDRLKNQLEELRREFDEFKKQF